MAILNNNMPHKYFSSSDCRILITNGQGKESWIDEAFSIEWIVNAPINPLYGYKDREIRAWTPGRKIVQGSLIMNFKRRNSITLAMTNSIENLLYKDITVKSESKLLETEQEIKVRLISYAEFINSYFYKLPTGMRFQDLGLPSVNLEEPQNTQRANALANIPIQGKEIKICNLQHHAKNWETDETVLHSQQSNPRSLADGYSTRRGVFIGDGYNESLLDELDELIIEEPKHDGNIISLNNNNPYNAVDTVLPKFLSGYRDSLALKNAQNPNSRERLKNIYWGDESKGAYNLPAPYDSAESLSRQNDFVILIGQKDPIDDSFEDFNPVDRIRIEDVKFQGEQQRISHAEKDVLRVAYPFLAKTVD